jgi:hypothetical protein
MMAWSRSTNSLLLGLVGICSGCGGESSGSGGSFTASGVTGPDPTTGDSSGAPTSGAVTATATSGATSGLSVGSSDVTDSGMSTGPDATGTTGAMTTGDPSTGAMTTGDPSTGDPGVCPLTQQHLPCDALSDDPLHAMGLNCTTAGNMWVDNDNAVAVAKLDFKAPGLIKNKQTWQVARAYGSHVDPNTQKPFWGPREGEKLLMISSGLLPAPNAEGAVIVADGDVYNNAGVGGEWDSDVMPPPMSAELGSPDPMGFTNCDGVNDCSNTLKKQWDLGSANVSDKTWFSFELTAPAIATGAVADANGYSFDFAFFSAEFPEYVDSQYNDIFVVWQASEAFTGNVTFVKGQPLTVTALWPIDYQGDCGLFNPGCPGGADEHLAGTGHIDDGGATSWYKASSGVNPGETFVLAFAIFDMGDAGFDTTALIDNWQWDCVGCVPNELDSCGIIPG